MNLLSKIFTKKNPLLKEAIDLSILETDLHSHLIPGIDDGAKSLQDSVDLILEMISLGYKKLITTPHIQNDLYKNTPEIILAEFEKVKEEINRLQIDVELEIGAEYLVDDGIMEKIKAGNLLTFGKNQILIELPYINEPPNLDMVLFELQVSGYNIILAHPERYSYWHKNPTKYDDLYNRNIKFQLNINSLTGWYSLESKKMAEMLIDKKYISYLGSDLHNLNYLQELKKSRYLPYLQKAIASNKILNSKL